MLIFSPQTVVKLSTGKPTITFNKKSGLISISGAARDVIGRSQKNFNFHYDEKEKTGYLVPEESGFEFRSVKETKSLAFNHSALCKGFLKANNVNEDVKSYQFLLTNGIKPNYACADGFLIYPVIKIR